jgi:hypothetical protein
MNTPTTSTFGGARQRCIQVVCLIFMAFVAPTNTQGQIGSQGQISGFLRDQQGAVVSGATVVVTHTGTRQSARRKRIRAATM